MPLKDRIADKAKASDAREQTTLCGEPVEVRRMTVGQRSHVMDVGYSKGAKPSVVYERFYPAVLTATVVEPGTDTPVFEAKDRDLINSLPPEEVDRVVEIALRLSGLDKEAPAQAEKNSDGANAA